MPVDCILIGWLTLPFTGHLEGKRFALRAYFWFYVLKVRFTCAATLLTLVLHVYCILCCMPQGSRISALTPFLCSVSSVIVGTIHHSAVALVYDMLCVCMHEHHH